MGLHRQTRVLFDGTCSFCQANARLLQRLDWFRTVTFIPIAEAGELARCQGLQPADLLLAMHSIGADGRIDRGADCFRRIGLRIPLLAPIALLLWVPGIHWLGHRIYNAISRNRHSLSRWFGCRDACAFPGTAAQGLGTESRRKNSHDT